MKARTLTDHQRDSHPPTGRMACLAFPLVIALGALWAAPSSPYAAPPAYRGTKGPERSSSQRDAREHENQRPLPGPSLGYRFRSAASAQPAANHGRDARDDCRDAERRGTAAGADEKGADPRPDPYGSHPPEPRQGRGGRIRRTPSSPIRDGRG